MRPQGDTLSRRRALLRRIALPLHLSVENCIIASMVQRALLRLSQAPLHKPTKYLTPEVLLAMYPETHKEGSLQIQCFTSFLKKSKGVCFAILSLVFSHLSSREFLGKMRIPGVPGLLCGTLKILFKIKRNVMESYCR